MRLWCIPFEEELGVQTWSLRSPSHFTILVKRFTILVITSQPVLRHGLRVIPSDPATHRMADIDPQLVLFQQVTELSPGL